MIRNDEVIVIDTKTGDTVKPGDTVTGFDGVADTYQGVSRLPQAGKSGKVITDTGEYYERVFSLEIYRDPEAARVRSLECRVNAEQADTPLGTELKSACADWVTLNGAGSDGPAIRVRMLNGMVEVWAPGGARLAVLAGPACNVVTVKPC